MNSKLLCNWLGLIGWPPDHYALLGLSQGESDVARIERQVQERMAKLRSYQLSHPEEATEGMNRVAQAFICLTETLSRQSYDRGLAQLNGAPPKEKPFSPADTQQLKATGTKTQLDWKDTPPPVRAAKETTAPPAGAIRADLPITPSTVNPADTATHLPAATMQAMPAIVVPAPADKPAPAAVVPTAVVPAPPTPAPAPTAPPIDPIIELAQNSTEARRGLGTLPLLIDRINLTRRLILAWGQAGKYLSNPAKKLTRTTEETDLTRRLNKIFELTAEYPKFVGHPGQPGYRVVAMARLEMTAQMFKVLDKTQREQLARDWSAGHSVLLAHRRFLRREFKTLRRRGPIQLVVQGIRGAINDHPLRVAAGVAVVLSLWALVYWRLF